MNKATLPSESVAGGIENLAKCPRCGATTQLDHGTCINCFLREGIEARGEESRETFESILLEANVTDTHWRLGHYEILEEIGRGGMGVIYRARQQHSRRIVAVKRVLAHQVNSHETLVRFRREAEAVASLDHPNILPIYEVSESEEALPFFSMKYATGGSLRMAAPSLRAKPRECVRLMAKIARAIAFAHRKGILHRDLQPGNVLLDENGEPMVSDFGLAKWLDQSSDLTRTLETLGTPGYIAPEQAECRATEVTTAADVYSLGAILFYLLTGRPPFVGPNVLHVIHQAAATSAPRLRSLIPSLDRDLETIVVRCLESDPEARYQSAGALADDLEHWLRHEPITTRRVGVFTRGGKWVRRNPTTAGLVAALIVLAAAIVRVTVWKSESSLPAPSLPAGIAVLPLQNLSEEKENAYFADGIQDELLTNLSKIRDLKVISRTSVMQYKSGITRNLKEIAQQLGVSNVVEGSVRRSGNHVRVSVQLIDAKTNRHLWAQNYDRTLADSVALQGDLATEIAAALGGTLSPQEKARVQAKPTKNTAAYDAYLRGRAFATRSYQKSYEDNAIQSYQEAVKLDPGFALAWARLSIAVGHNGWDPSPAQLASVKDAADHALTLDPDLPETHLAIGYYRYGQRDYTGALAEFQQAEQGLPNNGEVSEAIALVQRRLGHWEEAIAGLRRTIELDPRYHDAYENLAGTYRWLRRFPETLATVDQLLAWEPNDVIALGRKAAAFWAMGDLQAVEPLLTNPGFDSYDRGVQALFQRRYATAIEIFSAAPPSNLAPHPSTSERQLFLGLSQQRAGDVAAARATYRKAVQDFQRDLEKVVPGSWAEAWLRTCLGRAYAGMGEADSAIAEGEKAMAIDPASRNPVDGPVREEKMANIYALLGDADHAVPILKRLLQTTYAGAITPALLRLDPVWDQIRNDPRFQELAADGKPIRERSIAVLPFENLSADPENAFFADGVQDEILNDLAKIADLKVISRTSVMQYKTGVKRNLRQIANELGVAHVVEGSVQRMANRVRVAAQLIDAKTDTHLWAERYDRPLDDVFTIQSEIAKTIAGQLQAKLSPAEKAAIEQPPTTNLIAYDCYLRAKKLFVLSYDARIFENVRQSIRLLDQAVAHDPTFLLAYCLLARAHIYLYFLGVDHTSARVARANEARDTALRLAPDRGEAHLAAAWVAYLGHLDYETALTEVAIARRGLPNDASIFEITAFIARRQGHWQRFIKDLERAVELDPRSVGLLHGAAHTYQFLRRFSDMAQSLDRALAIIPGDPTSRVWRAQIDLESRADTQLEHDAIQKIVTEDPSTADLMAERWFDLALCRRDATETATALAALSPEGMQRNNVPTPRSFCEGLAARARNDVKGAETAFTATRVKLEKILRAQPDYAQALSTLGMVDAALGHKADALREGRHAVELLPVTKDAWTGAQVLTNLAITYAWAGEKDLAIKQLEELIRILSPITYGQLRLHPFWDPLRGDPRFEKIVEEAKKPVALEISQPLSAGIAVLPFENLSADPDNAFFNDGVQDEILNNLAKIADLKVISRTSVMQYKSGAKRNLRQIASELGVAHVVEGSVQRDANRVRVSAQLIDAKTDTHLWAERYDRPLDDVFAIQSEIAKAIAGQLQAKLSPAEKIAIEQPPTTNLVAYDRYVRAEKLWALPTTRLPQDMREIIRLLEQAVAHDPTFLVAYCELARAHAYVHHLGVDHTPARVALAEGARDTALRVAPDRGESHLAAAWVAYFCYRDYETALTEVGIARRKLPNNESVFSLPAYIARRQGHWKQSIGDLKRAIELDPRNVWLLTGVAQTYQSQRRFSDAAAVWDRVLAVAPGDASTRLWRGLIHLESRADTRLAQEAIQAVVTADPNAVDAIAEQWVYLAFCRRDAAEMASALASLPPEGIIPWNVRMPRSFFEGLAARVRNDLAGAARLFTAARVEMEKIVREQPDYAQALCVLGMIDAALGRKEDALRGGRRAAELLPVTKDAWAGAAVLTNLAIIYAWVGEKDLAIKQLEEAMQIPGPVSYGQLRLHPFWDPLRGDPRFEKLVEESRKPVALESLRLLPSGIAVLPFENLSADPENAFFADGVQDEILNNLAKIAELKVISRTSVLQYKSGAKRNLRQIANELGVVHVVEGNVQRTGNRVRVSAQLIDAKDDTHLWAESYDRPLDDVFAIQSEIAKAIGSQLKAKLSPTEKSAIEKPPTTNLIAYDRYLRARRLGARQTGRVPGEAREVIRLLEQAVAYDPTFMLAYCELARAHEYAYHLGVDRTPARVALAKAARDAALRLAPDRAEPHFAAASVAFHCDLDYETALKEVDIAKRTSPNCADVFALPAYIHRRQGHWENCARDLERAVQLDPRNVWLLQDTAQTYQFLRRFPEAAAAWDRTLEVAPGDPNTRVWRALVDMDSRADMQPMHDVIEKIIGEDPSAVDAIPEHWLYLTLCRRNATEMGRALASLPPAGIVRRDMILPRSFCEGLIARTRGDATLAETAFTASRAEMEKVLREQPDYAQALCVLGMSDAALGHKEDAIREGRRAVELLPVTKDMMAGGVVLANLAIIYAWTGEKDLALDQLAKAIRFPSSNFLSYGQLKLHPFWDPLRGDPRFEKLVEESKKPVEMNAL